MLQNIAPQFSPKPKSIFPILNSSDTVWKFKFVFYVGKWSSC